MIGEEITPLKNVLGMDYEPRNEVGVIILFSLVMKRLGYSGIIKAQGIFPDCIARKKGKQELIEFEYRSKNFLTHKHMGDLPRRKCMIICWENNWQNPPPRISVLSLSRELGLSNRVRLTHAQDQRNIDFLDSTRLKTTEWSMPAGTRKGDLLLVWRSGRNQSKFHDIFEALEDAIPKYGYSGYGKCRIVAHLGNPVTLQDIRNHRELGRSSMGKSVFFMGANKELTPYWPALYQLIIARNPGARKPLKGFAPGVFTI